MKRVLIIKLGYSETLDSALSLTTSLGDVLRTTVILHFFKGYHISWLVDKQAQPLLENNKYIKRILAYNSNTRELLKKEKFDIVVNLEKSPSLCDFSDSLAAGKYFGFRSDCDCEKITKSSKASKKITELSHDPKKRIKNKEPWQKILAGVIGKKWRDEPYILGYTPKSKVKYDIGFNWTTSNKWTNKAWPKDYWHRLEDLINDRYSISWQQGLSNLFEYIDWLNSCRLIITADTLGLHLSLALKKRTIALFGPTPPQEIYFYNLGSFLLPEAPYDCIPCVKPYCDKKKRCIKYISPERIMEKIEEEIKYG